MLEQKLYTVADVAEITGLTGRTIRNYLKDGILHGRKIGVQWRFTEEDVENLFSETDCIQDMDMLPKDLVSRFLEEEKRQVSESCLVMDIPLETKKQAEENLKTIEHVLSKKDLEEVQSVHQYFEQDNMLRMVLKGRTEIVRKAMTGIEKGLFGNEK